MNNIIWRQNTPVDQLKVIRMSLEGHLDNFLTGVIDKEKFGSVAREHLDQIWALEPFLEGKEPW